MDNAMSVHHVFSARKRVVIHWPEYLMEGLSLGLFMISACTFAAILEYPSSALHLSIPNATVRRVLMGLAMGTTAVALIYSPFGKRSGAHINPSITLTFFRLGKMEPIDALLYIVLQFVGSVAGVLLARAVLMERIAHPSVNYVVTRPGRYGELGAFVAEIMMTFILMFVILSVSNIRALNRYTGLFAGAFVMIYISVEAPISGMSMNPARTFGSAFAAHVWTGIWIYFTAPPIGMLLAAELYLRLHGLDRVLCAKLHHENSERCIFRCNYR
jgi:aquaporin Z